MSSRRTNARTERYRCTVFLHAVASGARVGALFLAALAPGLALGVDERPGASVQPRREARGWLELDRDQRAFRERVEPSSSREGAALERLEQRQKAQLRELQVKQRREGQTRRPPLRDSAAVQRRDLDRQRLDMRLQREALSRHKQLELKPSKNPLPGWPADFGQDGQ